MSDKLSDAVQRHLELRAAAAGMRADARREQRREERRARREREKEARAEQGEAGVSPGGCLKFIVVTTVCIAAILVLLILLVMAAPKNEPPTAAPSLPAKQTASAKSAAAPPLKPLDPTPTTLAAPPSAPASGQDVTLSLASIRLPSPYAPTAVAVVTVTNNGSLPVVVRIDCNFVSEDGALLDHQSASVNLEARASSTREISGNTGRNVFRANCAPVAIESVVP